MKKNSFFYLAGMIGLVLSFIVVLAGCDDPTKSTDLSHSLDGSRYEGPLPAYPDIIMILEFDDGQFLLMEQEDANTIEYFQKGPYFVDGDTIYMLASHDYDLDKEEWVANNPKRWGTGTLKDSGNTINFMINPMDVYKVR